MAIVTHLCHHGLHLLHHGGGVGGGGHGGGVGGGGVGVVEPVGIAGPLGRVGPLGGAGGEGLLHVAVLALVPPGRKVHTMLPKVKRQNLLTGTFWSNF